MNRLLSILLLVVMAQTVVRAQEKKDAKRPSQRNQNKMRMKEQIKKLKEGVLLVRLQTKENSIIALRKIGRDDLANKTVTKQIDYNLEIISAFRKNFTFCPTYFFFSNYSDSILSKQINGIIFLNDSLKPDPIIKLNNNNFLTAEFGIIEQDTAKYFESYYYYSSGNGLERRSSYYGGPDMRFGVLKIMSEQLIQLKRPFPYYVRTYTKRKLSKVVSLMNRKLISYYVKNNN